MITLEINGERIECDSEKDARKAIRIAAKKEAAECKAREIAWNAANAQAQAKGYRILSRKAIGEIFPRAWRLYRPHDEWSKHLYQRIEGDFPSDRKTRLECENGSVVLSHYANTLIGVVCGGAGYSLAVVLQDDSTKQITIYAVGAVDGVVALAECAGVVAEDFSTKD